MTKIFAKVRKRLVQNEKFGKYIIYAIGEILIVIIGILIAVWINNKNQDQGLSRIEREYLNQISSDFSKDLKQLERLADDKEVKAAACDSLLLHFNGKPVENFEAFTLLIYNTSYSGSFNPNTTTFDELINSGQLSQIKNKVLRYELSSAYSAYKNLLNFRKSLEVDDKTLYETSLKLFDFQAAGNSIESPTNNALTDSQRFKIRSFLKSMESKNIVYLSSIRNEKEISLIKELRNTMNQTIQSIE